MSQNFMNNESQQLDDLKRRCYHPTLITVDPCLLTRFPSAIAPASAPVPLSSRSHAQQLRAATVEEDLLNLDLDQGLL